MTQLLYKVHRSLRAVQSAFYRKGVVAQKKIQAIKKRWAFLMAWIERASVFIMIASDHNKNRDETRGLLIQSGVALRLRGQLINRI